MSSIKEIDEEDIDKCRERVNNKAKANRVVRPSIGRSESNEASASIIC